jgi:hypothetical protein
MELDYFAILGLTPGRYRPDEVQRRFQAERDALVAKLADAAQSGSSRARLEALHLAYRTLADPRSQVDYLATHRQQLDAATRLRRLIAASLEGGLLRYSRRQEILRYGGELGFNEFQIHLLIAQVQFGDDVVTTPRPRPAPDLRGGERRAALRLAAAAALALALGLAALRWLGV